MTRPEKTTQNTTACAIQLYEILNATQCDEIQQHLKVCK